MSAGSAGRYRAQVVNRLRDRYRAGNGPISNSDPDIRAMVFCLSHDPIMGGHALLVDNKQAVTFVARDDKRVVWHFRYNINPDRPGWCERTIVQVPDDWTPDLGDDYQHELKFALDKKAFDEEMCRIRLDHPSPPRPAASRPAASRQLVLAAWAGSLISLAVSVAALVRSFL